MKHIDRSPQPLDLGLAILDILTQTKRPLGSREIAERLEVDATAISDVLSTLLDRGFILADESGEGYILGQKLIDLCRRTIDI